MTDLEKLIERAESAMVKAFTMHMSTFHEDDRAAAAEYATIALALRARLTGEPK